LYGQPETERPEQLKKADEVFIKKAANVFEGNREEASIAWCEVGDEFFEKGDFYNGMRRYNQAWLLNPNNYLAYWGFGRIMLQRNEYDESLKHFETANELIDDEYQKPALLSDTGVAYSYKAQSVPIDNKIEREKLYSLANKYFYDASELDKTYTEVWRRWAYSLDREEKYLEAWEKVKKARSLGATPFPEEFLMKLNEKMPEPKSIIRRKSEISPKPKV
jgi:tetratricopeptide (TPR) repeat protein